MKNLNILKPSKLDVDPNSPTASNEWKHWHHAFTNYIEECGESEADRFKILVNCVSYTVYDQIKECSDYESAIKVLQNLYVKTPPNAVLARHLLATRKQHPGESLDDYLQELRKLSKDCDLKATLTAEQYRQELICDAFISGIASPLIRQHLLENRTLNLESIYSQAHILDLAQRNIDGYVSTSVTNAVRRENKKQPQLQTNAVRRENKKQPQLQTKSGEQQPPPLLPSSSSSQFEEADQTLAAFFFISA
uniref:Retrotransposon gag domain-containing protein n=1 Tax=Penaeus semisulcatus majanivirus TaxID=2984274 RepID=A0A9C7F7S3_9VIRU|nr:MAG: hypothetical protein [Penaeus semisulcatus majanivirus]